MLGMAQTNRTAPMSHQVPDKSSPLRPALPEPKPALDDNRQAKTATPSVPPLLLCARRFNFSDGVLTAAVDARTLDGRIIPTVRRVEIVVPERPSPALVGADRVDRAAAAALAAGRQKDTVFGC